MGRGDFRRGGVWRALAVGLFVGVACASLLHIAFERRSTVTAGHTADSLASQFGGVLRAEVMTATRIAEGLAAWTAHDLQTDTWNQRASYAVMRSLLGRMVLAHGLIIALEPEVVAALKPDSRTPHMWVVSRRKGDLLQEFEAPLGAMRLADIWYDRIRQSGNPVVTPAFPFQDGAAHFRATLIAVPITEPNTGRFLGVAATMYSVSGVSEATSDKLPPDTVAFAGLLDADGVWLSHTQPEEVGRLASAPLWKAARQRQRNVGSLSDPDAGLVYGYAAVPTVAGDGEWTAVVAGRSDYVARLAGTGGAALVVPSALAGVLGALAALWVARRRETAKAESASPADGASTSIGTGEDVPPAASDVEAVTGELQAALARIAERHPAAAPDLEDVASAMVDLMGGPPENRRTYRVADVLARLAERLAASLPRDERVCLVVNPLLPGQLVGDPDRIVRLLAALATGLPTGATGPVVIRVDLHRRLVQSVEIAFTIGWAAPAEPVPGANLLAMRWAGAWTARLGGTLIALRRPLAGTEYGVQATLTQGVERGVLSLGLHDPVPPRPLLLVEPEPAIREALAWELTLRGAEVTPCSTAKEAMSFLNAVAFGGTPPGALLIGGLSADDAASLVRRRSEEVPAVLYSLSAAGDATVPPSGAVVVCGPVPVGPAVAALAKRASAEGPDDAAAAELGTPVQPVRPIDAVAALKRLGGRREGLVNVARIFIGYHRPDVDRLRRQGSVDAAFLHSLAGAAMNVGAVPLANHVRAAEQDLVEGRSVDTAAIADLLEEAIVALQDVVDAPDGVLGEVS